MAHPGGRPSIYSITLATDICTHIANGMSLRKVCEKEGMPSIETVRQWLIDEDKSEFLAQYTRAREEQADFYADDIIEQADKAFDKDSAAAAKVKIDARKWVASKLKPRKYGNQLDLTSGGDKIKQAPLVVSTIKARNVETQQETS